MKGLIIVNGNDATGKTTIVKKINEMYIKN